MGKEISVGKREIQNIHRKLPRKLQEHLDTFMKVVELYEEDEVSKYAIRLFTRGGVHVNDTFFNTFMIRDRCKVVPRHDKDFPYEVIGRINGIKVFTLVEENTLLYDTFIAD